MKGSLVLLLADTPDHTQVVIAQGEITGVLSGGTHYLCRMARKGYRVSEILSVQRLEKALIFDRAEDLAAFFAENNPPPQAVNDPSACVTAAVVSVNQKTDVLTAPKPAMVREKQEEAFGGRDAG